MNQIKSVAGAEAADVIPKAEYRNRPSKRLQTGGGENRVVEIALRTFSTEPAVGILAAANEAGDFIARIIF